MPDETYYQGTEIVDLLYGVGSNLDTTAAYFDSSHVRCSVHVASSGSSENNCWVETPETMTIDEFWFRISLRVVPATSSVRYNFIKFYDEDGVEFLSLLLPATGGSTAYDRIAVYRTGTTLLGTSSTGLTLSASVHKIIMQVVLGNPGIVRIYNDTTLIFEDTALDLSGAASISKVRFSNVGGSATSWRFSEVIIANYDLRGSYLVSRTADANGTDNQWASQDYTIIDDLNPTSYIFEDDVGDRMSYSFADFPAPSGSTVIETLKLAAYVSTDVGKLPLPYLKIGGSNYDADPEDLQDSPPTSDSSVTFNISHTWSRNPATNARFTHTVLNAAEFGLLSVGEPLGIMTGDTLDLLVDEDEVYTSVDVNAYGGTPPYTFSFVGSWPTGLSIDSSTGVISGTPTTAGEYTGLNVKVTDDDGNEALLEDANFTIVVVTDVTNYGAEASRSTDQTGADYTTAAAVPFETEDYDHGGYFTVGTSATRLTVPSGVYYVVVHAAVNLSDFSAVNLDTQIRIRKNGVADFDGASGLLFSGGVQTQMTCRTGPIPVVAGDYFELFLLQYSDNSIRVNVSDTHFWIEAVG